LIHFLRPSHAKRCHHVIIDDSNPDNSESANHQLMLATVRIFNKPDCIPEPRHRASGARKPLTLYWLWLLASAPYSVHRR
jgi:hypothetical protein